MPETAVPETPLAAPGEGGKAPRRLRSRKCRFCRMNFPPDYKDVITLQKLCTGQGKMYSRKRAGNCAYHQRLFTTAVKQARFLSLLSYTG